jgi:hypothetical protein
LLSFPALMGIISLLSACWCKLQTYYFPKNLWRANGGKEVFRGEKKTYYYKSRSLRKDWGLLPKLPVENTNFNYASLLSQLTLWTTFYLHDSKKRKKWWKYCHTGIHEEG